MKRSLAAVLSLGLLLAACDQPASPSATKNPVPEAYRDTTGAAWSYKGPASALPLGITADSPLFSSSLSASSSWGPIELNTSNGEKSAGDGHPITMNGVVYPYGLGLHAGAEISYSSTQATGVNCELTAEVGVDDEVGSKGSVSFQVYADGNKLYDSGRLTGADPAKHLAATIPSARSIRLVVTNGGDDYYYDHADIANPTISCSQSSVPMPPAPQQILFGNNVDSPSGGYNPALGRTGINTYAINVDGTGGRYLSHNKTEEFQPRVSPDGKKVVFSDVGARNDVLGIVTRDIYVENLDGTDRVRLTNSSTFDGNPTWSPDGKKIAFVHATAMENCRGCVFFTDIFTMNADGSGVTRLTTNQTSDKPDWSPDGKKIAFQSYLGRTGDLGLNIYTINVDGTNQKQLTTDFSGANADWSPDGTQLVFSHSVNGFFDDLDLYVMDASGGHLRRITDSAGVEVNPNWSPDGKQILYRAGNGRFGGNGFFVVNADGTGQKLVYALPEFFQDIKADWLSSNQ